MLSIKYSEIRQNGRNSFITVPWFFTVLHSETSCPSGFTVCENMFRLDLYCTIPWRIIKPPTLSQKLSESPYKNRTYEGWSRCNGILVTGFWTYSVLAVASAPAAWQARFLCRDSDYIFHILTGRREPILRYFAFFVCS